MSNDTGLDIVRLACFERDLKKLRKKYRTLDDDIETFISTALKLFHDPLFPAKDHFDINEIPGLGIEHPNIYKACKFACKSLKGTGVRSGIRIIYAFFEEDRRVELIEIYYKGDKENENRERILKKYKGGDEYG